MNPMSVPLYTLLYEQVNPETVISIKKNILTIITPKYYVINSTRIMDTGFACHNVITYKEWQDDKHYYCVCDTCLYVWE